jgi:hypothetical protein
MNRPDNAGMFWDDTPPPRPPTKEKIKREPPERTWERPDYLPYLAEAKAFWDTTPQFGPGELQCAAEAREVLIFDTECAPNYFLLEMMSMSSGKTIVFEFGEHVQNTFDPRAIWWVLANFLVVGFNSNSYDIPMILLALAGFNNQQLKAASDAIIIEGIRGYELLRGAKIKYPQINHIDIIEVAPLSESLKSYAGRLHAPRMQDLPFNPHNALSADQTLITRLYCRNDLINTACVKTALEEMLRLREILSARYGIDLRSKSDAQVAEAVIAAQARQHIGGKISKPEIEVGRIHKYVPPSYMGFQTESLRAAFATIVGTDFVVSAKGNIPLPESVAALRIECAGNVYQLGVGGLHSTETRVVRHAVPGWSIRDIDVVSYYPRIILNSGMYPAQIGPCFQTIYQTIVEQRLAAKKRGDKASAESMKIMINGTFGKTASPHSILYAPQLGMFTTVTGQLSLLMFIEQIGLAGINVLSANTDGVVSLVPDDKLATFQGIVKWWEQITGFETEETLYTKYYGRDVNAYMAFKADGSVKLKGAYGDPWRQMSKDAKQGIMRFHKNPVTTICIEAVEQFLADGKPMELTLWECKDVRKFVAVRKVKGGAVKNGEYLGKSIRWYYGAGETGEIIYAITGNKVAKTEGARPLMNLPVEVPADIDYDHYYRECLKILGELGVIESIP